MDERLTWAEIERRYPDEWVLIADPETTPESDIVAGQLICHSKDPEPVNRRADELRLKDGALLFTGLDPWPNRAFLL
jgi:hypothetical protein